MKFLDLLLGKPLASYAARAEQVGAAAGIPIFGLDALSSAAYGPEAALTILIPLGTDDAPDSIVLRPVESVDGMTARSAAMPQPLLQQITGELLALEGIAGVFYDLTHKPPGTIEWE